MDKRGILSLTSTVLESFTRTLLEHNFYWVPTPIIVPVSGACENVNTLFSVAPFYLDSGITNNDENNNWWGGEKAFLAQTGQLHLEQMLYYNPKVFTVGPSCRAEEKIDGRHLTEFTLFEFELRGNFDTLKYFISVLFENLCNNLLEKLFENPDVINSSEVTVPLIKRIENIKDIQTISYKNCIDMLHRDKQKIEFGDDIHSIMEQNIIKQVNGRPVLITNYPNNQHDNLLEIEIEKFFNMKVNPINNMEVLSCDLILPISGEALGGAERIFRIKELKERFYKSKMWNMMHQSGLTSKNMESYFKAMTEHGETIGTHSGCGIGIPRLVQYLVGDDNIENIPAFKSTSDQLL